MASYSSEQNNFPPNIQAALQQAANETRRRGKPSRVFRSRPGHHGGRHHHFGRGHPFGQPVPQVHGYPQLPQTSEQYPPPPLPTDFPPSEGPFPAQVPSQGIVVNLPPRGIPPPALSQIAGSQGPAFGSSVSVESNDQSQPAPMHSHRPQELSNTYDTFSQRAARGIYGRPHGQGHGYHRGRSRGLLHQQPQPPLSPETQYQPQTYNHHHLGRGHRRGNFNHPRLYNPNSPGSSSSGPVSPNRGQYILQCTYLNDLANCKLKNCISEKELRNHEAFRKKLERLLQDMVKEWAKENVTVNPAHVKLKCYGSMANGFAVPGSDMDLMLMFPKDEGPIGAIETECRRMLEKKILDAGYGARLLTKTRVPILRVCQDPSQELLDDLRQYRVKSLEQDREDEVERKMKLLGLKASRLPDDLVSAPVDLQQQLDVAASVPLPPSPIKENSIIEWDKTVGIQCDINFSNYVAVYNTQLLRCYCICDDRVRQLGLVVKSWVKARKINTPYFGTLSSYGYILMVLHYLMNVADPPVIPNLQMWAKEKYENTQDVPLFEGMDIRFMGDEPTLRRMSAAGELTRNQEPLGSLLRGFFGYYADPRGFHYTQEVVSIRTQGGILRKASKGWTEAKRAGNDNSIKLRYLLCIEDPFEIEHNIARTVGHHGIVAIRNEFRRAWEIVNRIEYSEESGWQWRRSDGSTGEDLFEPAEDRGDLLRKDTEFNRERTRAAAKLRDEKAAAQQQTDTKSIADGKSTAAVYEGRVAEAKVAHPPVKTSPSDIQDVEGHIHDGSMPAKFNNLEYRQGVKTGANTKEGE